MKNYIYQKVAIITLMFFCLQASFAQDNMQLNIDNEISSTFPELIDIKSANSSLKLDSIYEDINTGYQIIKRKWLFNYENNRLISKKHLYYTVDYNNQLGIRDEWFYNENGQVKIYQQSDRISEITDSIFIQEYEENTYKNDKLLLKRTKTMSGGSVGSRMVNGERVIEIDINYSEDLIHYFYNEDGMLTLECKQNSKDSTFYYYYGNNKTSRLRMKVRMMTSNNRLEVEKYEYTESNTSKHISKESGYLNNTTDISNIDTVTHWNEFLYDSEHDDNGRATKLTVTTNFLGIPIPSLNSQTFYKYNQAGQPEYISIYFCNGETSSEGEWYEQARLIYTYNEDGNISLYQMYIFDARLHEWVIGEQKTYYYSSLKSTVSNHPTSKMEVSIYPNPVKETIYLSGSVEKGSSYIIHDYSGKNVAEGTISDNSVDVSNLRKGLYLINIYNDKARTVKRFIKE